MKNYEDFTVDIPKYEKWYNINCNNCGKYIEDADGHDLFDNLSVYTIVKLIEAHDCNS